MKVKIFLPALICISFFSCFENDKKLENTATAVGRDFIRATLDGNFKDAESLLIKDSLNVEIFASYKNYYTKLADDKKKGYKNANIIINTMIDVNDSTSIIDYSNSFMNQPQKIKLVKHNTLWVVDFKYTSCDTSISK